MVQRKEIRVMNIKEMNPVVNIGTEKSPLMVLDATIMVLKYEQATGKNYKVSDMDDYIRYVDGYRDGYNATVEEAQMTKAYDGTTSVLLGGQLTKAYAG
jgi:hypothetical protein